MKKTCPYKYEEADKYFVVNDGDIDMTPVCISLPKPPPLHTIDGYGLPPEEQVFKRLEEPQRLIDLAQEALDLTKDELSSNKNNVVTLLKIQRKFWELLQERNKEYKKEIAYIRRVWYHRIKGFWFYNNGKPTFLSGWHFFYLNYWTMDVKGKVSFPDYRERDRKEYLYKLYQLTTTETFKHLDSEGHAIPNEDGTYSMIDTERRVCYGNIQPKNRRSGNTNKSLSDGIEIVSRTEGTDGGGIQSYSEDNAGSHFKDKLMPAYFRMPIWLQPFTTSGRTSNTLKFDVEKNAYGDDALGTLFDYATTSSSKFYDGKKKKFLLTDEAGKTSSVTDVAERHEVNKHTIAQGDGSDIHGFMEYPSTVEELKEGAFHYRRLAEGSNFYVRQENGQTESGLFRIFIPADEGLDNYIDKYGRSVKGELTEEHKKLGFKKTATQHLNARRDFLRNKGDSESMKLFRDYKKLFPLKYEDCFLGDAGSLGFNHERLDESQARLRRENPCVRGNLEWVNGVYGTSVYFKSDEESGRWTFDEMPPSHVINQVVEANMFNPLTGKVEPQKRPRHGNLYVIGTDTFNFLGKQQQNAGKKTSSKSGKHSDGGMSMLLKYDESIDVGKPMEQWITHRFVMTYRNRHGSTYDFNEDVLKTAIFTGGMVFPEMNLTDTYEYFLVHGYGGFMLYALDKFTGQYKDKPGISSLENSKQEIFSDLRDYIEHRIHMDNMYDLQKELREIKDMSAMRYHDLLASAGVCLIGAKSQYVEEMFEGVADSYDIEDYLDFYDV